MDAGEQCDPGKWRPTSFSASGIPQSMVTPWLGGVLPFTVSDIMQFLPEPAPALTSHEYARDYNEVTLLGRAASAEHPSARTPEQEASALFFREGPPGYWNRTLEFIVAEHVPDTGDRARLYALVQLSMADAIIAAWHNKKYFNVWRPETAIREGHLDGNPNTTGTLNHFFGTDEMTFLLRGANNMTRPYSRFSDVADDVCEARILEGTHFRFADSVARTQGRDVAKNAFKTFLRPVDDAPALLSTFYFVLTASPTAPSLSPAACLDRSRSA